MVYSIFRLFKVRNIFGGKLTGSKKTIDLTKLINTLDEKDKQAGLLELNTWIGFKHYERDLKAQHQNISKLVYPTQTVLPKLTELFVKDAKEILQFQRQQK